jgi:hypothetical protein
MQTSIGLESDMSCLISYRNAPSKGRDQIIVELPNSRETFLPDMVSWGKNEYTSQWKNAVEFLKLKGLPAALVTSFGSGPSKVNRISYITLIPLDYVDGPEEEISSFQHGTVVAKQSFGFVTSNPQCLFDPASYSSILENFEDPFPIMPFSADHPEIFYYHLSTSIWGVSWWAINALDISVGE